MRPASVVVLSLPRRADRRAAQGDLSWLGAVEHHEALGPSEVTVPARWRSSPESFACLASHQRALAAAGDSILIFEDDAVVPRDFWARFEAFEAAVPPDWQGLWLGGEHCQAPVVLSRGVSRCVFTLRTHAYLLRGAGIERALTLMAGATRHWDIVLAEQTRATELPYYAPHPFLVPVSHASGDIPDSRPLGQVRSTRPRPDARP